MFSKHKNDAKGFVIHHEILFRFILLLSKLRPTLFSEPKKKNLTRLKRTFGNDSTAGKDGTNNVVETILNILETKPVPGRGAEIQPQKYPPR